MLKIEVTGNMSIETALKKYKSKYIKTKVLKELNERKTFKKKSIKKRDLITKAKYIQNKRLNENKDL